MKLGILTFHSQLNYGGVLQCWALQTALEKLGHEVVVIDRLMEVQLRSVRAIFRGWSLRQWVGLLLRLALRRPSALRVIRHVRTVRFAQRHLHLTNYSFRDWSDAPKDLGVDMIVVGSDQVWNPSWNSLGIYMLEGAPNVPAIGYAISLGVTEIPRAKESEFRAAASRFVAVSAREESAVEVLKAYFADIPHVVDPVLLVDNEVKVRRVRLSGHRHFVGYFIQSKMDEHLPCLQQLASENDLTLHLLVDGRQNQPQSVAGYSRIKFHLTAGPMEFLHLMATSDGVLTDSFHAVMYAYKFKKPLAVLRPSGGERLKMFDRIEEFLLRQYIGTALAGTIPELAMLACNQVCSWRSELEGYPVSESVRWLKKELS